MGGLGIFNEYILLKFWSGRKAKHHSAKKKDFQALSLQVKNSINKKLLFIAVFGGEKWKSNVILTAFSCSGYVYSCIYKIRE